MDWSFRKLRERQAREKALRQECAALRRIAAHTDLAALGRAELLDVMKRARDARQQLSQLINAHDDSPIRLVKFAGGAVIAGAGAIGLSLAAPVAVIAFIGGIALSANEARGIADTHLTLISDGLLAQVLDELQSGIEAAMKARGWT